MIVLHHAHVSTCSQRVRQALAEKKLGWEGRIVALDANEHLGSEYLAMNPNGLVPTLVHNERAVADSSVIMEYLEDVFPENALRPEDPYDLAQMRFWVRYLDELATKATRYPSFHQAFGKRIGNLTEEERRKRAAARPLREDFYLQLQAGGFSEGLLELADRQLIQTFARADKALRNGQWLVGSQFTIADISLLPTLVRMDDLGKAALYEPFDALMDWYQRIQARPSFAKAYYAESRLKLS